MTAVDIVPPTYSRRAGTTSPTATRVGPDTVVCATCGCRLTTRDAAGSGHAAVRDFFHFAGAPGRDARGCAVACADSAHRVA